MGDGSGSNSHDLYDEDSSEGDTELGVFYKDDWSFSSMSDDSPDIVEETTEEIYIKEDNVDI